MPKVNKKEPSFNESLLEVVQNVCTGIGEMRTKLDLVHDEAKAATKQASKARSEASKAKEHSKTTNGKVANQEKEMQAVQIWQAKVRGMSIVSVSFATIIILPMLAYLVVDFLKSTKESSSLEARVSTIELLILDVNNTK